MDAKTFFKDHPEVGVAFSGGVDSAYLLYLANRNCSRVCAYYVRSQFQPDFEYEDAVSVCSKIGVDLFVIDVDVLADETVVSNPADRCYHCKKRIFSAIIDRADKDGFNTVFDGTNASDDEGDRPGMRALREMGVISPLKILGLSKDRIRQLSKEAGLITWNKPAYACLATRIPTGEKITAKKLSRTADAEKFMMSLGFSDFRVRTRGDNALIQIVSSDMELFCEKRKTIHEKLSQMYEKVMLDTEARDEH